MTEKIISLVKKGKTPVPSHKSRFLKTIASIMDTDMKRSVFIYETRDGEVRGLWKNATAKDRQWMTAQFRAMDAAMQMGEIELIVEE